MEAAIEEPINGELVLELVRDTSTRPLAFKLAAMNRAFRDAARERFEAFMDRLAATAQRLGQRSRERALAYHANRYNTEYHIRDRKVVGRDWKGDPVWDGCLEYWDRKERHPHNHPTGNPGVGYCHNMYGRLDQFPTRDQTFVCAARDEFVEHARSVRRVHADRGGWWRRDHALCEPFFYQGPINFYRRMHIANRHLYAIVMHGTDVTAEYNDQGRHQRFFIRRLLQSRA